MEFHDTCAPEEELIIEKPAQDIKIDFMICLIQKIERGRQGIERVEYAKYLKKMEIKKIEKNKRFVEGNEITEETEREDARIVIQKYFRGYKGR